MRRIAVVLALVAAFAIGIPASLVRLSAAQGSTPDAASATTTASHPVVGLWRVTNELGEGNVFPSLAMFHADGAYIEDYPDAMSYSMGVWEPTGERTALLNVDQVYVIDDRLVNAEGRWTVEVNEAGDALRTAGTFVGTFEDGSIDIAVDWEDEDYPVTRLGISPVAPLAELVPDGMTVIPADATAAGTPAS